MEWNDRNSEFLQKYNPSRLSIQNFLFKQKIKLISFITYLQTAALIKHLDIKTYINIIVFLCGRGSFCVTHKHLEKLHRLLDVKEKGGEIIYMMSFNENKWIGNKALCACSSEWTGRSRPECYSRHQSQ